MVGGKSVLTPGRCCWPSAPLPGSLVELIYRAGFVGNRGPATVAGFPVSESPSHNLQSREEMAVLRGRNKGASIHKDQVVEYFYGLSFRMRGGGVIDATEEGRDPAPGPLYLLLCHSLLSA